MPALVGASEVSLVDGWPTSDNIYREEDKKLSGQMGGGGACL